MLPLSAALLPGRSPRCALDMRLGWLRTGADFSNEEKMCYSFEEHRNIITRDESFSLLGMYS